MNSYSLSREIVGHINCMYFEWNFDWTYELDSIVVKMSAPIFNKILDSLEDDIGKDRVNIIQTHLKSHQL